MLYSPTGYFARYDWQGKPERTPLTLPIVCFEDGHAMVCNPHGELVRADDRTAALEMGVTLTFVHSGREGE